MATHIIQPDQVFGGAFILTKSLFVQQHGTLPSSAWINQIHPEKVLSYLRQTLETQIKSIHQQSEYEHHRKKIAPSTVVIQLQNGCIIELSHTYCEVLHTESQAEFAYGLIKELSKFREAEKKTEFEINIIVPGSYGLELKSMEVKKTRLNLDLYYEDDFKEIDEIIRKRLNTKKDKGIVLLHGLPGTGKTTYLRYLIGKIRKKVIFISSEAARQATHPQLLDLLIDNPESVLIIEDAENVIKDRKTDADSSVSNLLNISDGLLADFLNIQIICTFNNDLSTIDQALLRKGRMIARYEFCKLSVEKAQQLSTHLGFDMTVTEPMTIAEITNPNDKLYESKSFRVIGFQPKTVSLTSPQSARKDGTGSTEEGEMNQAVAKHDSGANC